MIESACIVVGVAEYLDATMQPLPGAAVDADRFFSAATSEATGICSAALSCALINPTTQSVREQIAKYVYESSIKNLTIFFAGHGTETKSGYYLACTDSDSKRLALTGLSLTDIFQILNESSGVHVNIIIDACQAGAIALDIPALTKSFEMGVAGGMSVSLLALSSRYEPAAESIDGSGGYGTKALLSIMTGEIDTGSNKNELSLADISQLILMDARQNPSFWSFNIQGKPAFCKNFFAITHRPMEVFMVPPSDVLGDPLAGKSMKDKLWLYYLEGDKRVDARRLYYLLQELQNEVGVRATAAILPGLFDSFLGRSRNGPDSFSSVQLSAVFAVFSKEKLESSELSSYFFKVLANDLSILLRDLAEDIERDELFLVRAGGGYSEFFNLPQRITLLAAWTLSSFKFSSFLGSDTSAAKIHIRRILASLSRNYAGAFELVSESQAAGVVCISSLARLAGEVNFAEEFAGALYNSYLLHGGKVARSDLRDDEVFKFLRHRISVEKADYNTYCDRPTESLFALLAHYWVFESMDIVRFDFHQLDGTVLGTFVPASYKHFSDETIMNGSNVYFKVGFEVFTAKDCASFFTDHLSWRIQGAAKDMSELDSCIALIASLVFPDRVPWHLLMQSP